MLARLGLLTSLLTMAQLPANAQDETQQQMLELVFESYKRAVPDATQEQIFMVFSGEHQNICLLYTSPSPRDQRGSRMPSSA